MEEMYRRANEEGMIECRNCGNAGIEKNYGDRIITCIKCKKKRSLTAGTFFERMRLARPWLAAIWLMEHGVSLSSSKFQKLVGIAYSSAWNIFKKLTSVIQIQMGEAAVSVSSFLFSSLICKRSRETPARAHPIAEQEQIERNSPEDGGVGNGGHDPANASSEFGTTDRDPFCNRNSPPKNTTASLLGINVARGKDLNSSEESFDASTLSGREKQVYDLLSAEPAHFDILCKRSGMQASGMSSTLTMLELAGAVLRLAGDQYIHSTPTTAGLHTVIESSRGKDSTTETTSTVAAVIDFVGLNFQGISRKYLQNYLAWYWCHTDRTRWSLGSLLKACLRFRPVCYAEILEYVSPPFVTIVLRGQ